MVWRILLVLFKSALAVALLELMAPFGDAVGLHLTFVPTVARAISHAAAIPYREAELLFLFALATALLEGADFCWRVIVG